LNKGCIAKLKLTKKYKKDRFLEEMKPLLEVVHIGTPDYM
jgi:hypothetical protein